MPNGVELAQNVVERPLDFVQPMFRRRFVCEVREPSSAHSSFVLAVEHLMVRVLVAMPRFVFFTIEERMPGHCMMPVELFFAFWTEKSGVMHTVVHVLFTLRAVVPRMVVVMPCVLFTLAAAVVATVTMMRSETVVVVSAAMLVPVTMGVMLVFAMMLRMMFAMMFFMMLVVMLRMVLVVIAAVIGIVRAAMFARPAAARTTAGPERHHRLVQLAGFLRADDLHDNLAHLPQTLRMDVRPGRRPAGMGVAWRRRMMARRVGRARMVAVVWTPVAWSPVAVRPPTVAITRTTIAGFCFSRFVGPFGPIGLLVIIRIGARPTPLLAVGVVCQLNRGELIGQIANLSAKAGQARFETSRLVARARVGLGEKRSAHAGGDEHRKQNVTAHSILLRAKRASRRQATARPPCWQTSPPACGVGQRASRRKRSAASPPFH